jgi:hypothetical protein
MPITFTNRKGQKFFLCKGTTKTGKPRYTFSRQSVGETVDQIPEGFRIQESVNGIVSLVKDRPQLITLEEVDKIKALLKAHSKGEDYRVDIKDNQIVVYERLGPDVTEIAAIFGKISLLPSKTIHNQIRQTLEKNAQYGPIMRFVLRDKKMREFKVERWHFGGSDEGWIVIADAGPIDQLAKKFIPMLGTDKFFEQY